MPLAQIHGLCGVPVGKPSARAGGAEREMQLSEVGELELSTADRDAVAASGPATLEGELAGLVRTQPCQELPPASAGVA